MDDRISDEAKTAYKFVRAFVLWVLLAGVIGLVGGLVGSAFYMSVYDATVIREGHAWLIWLLPAGGLAIAGLYRLTKMESTNTNAIIDAIHLGDRVPVVLVPVIFLGTTITHLLGGSAGREGAALQIGGGIGSAVGRVFRLDDKDLRLATLCGMSAVFSALFGTPLTATLFALEVISVGVLYYSGLLPCLVSSIVAFGVTQFFGIPPTRFTVTGVTLSAAGMAGVAVLGVLCALMSILFCSVMHGTEKLAAAKMPNPYLRAAAGGALIIALTYISGTHDYNGAGVAVITRAVEDGQADSFAFLWKLLFTAVTLGFGFKGGEVVPTFFIGAVLGCVAGPLVGLPAGFSAAVGLVAMFCGAVNCPVTAIALAVELFNSYDLIYFALACGISYMLSGYFGLYSSQKILYSKLRAEYINIQAK